jgi:hypothetical protein
MVSIETAASTSNVELRLRAGSTDLSSSVYIRGELLVGAQTSFGFSTANNIGVSSAVLASAGSSIPAAAAVDLAYPFAAIPKIITSSASGRLGQWNNAYINSSVSHDGLTILGGANLTGSVSVYGYRK